MLLYPYTKYHTKGKDRAVRRFISACKVNLTIESIDKYLSNYLHLVQTDLSISAEPGS